MLTDQILSAFQILTSKQLCASSQYITDLTRKERHTFACLSSYADLRNADHCFVKYSTLALKAQKSLSTVKRHVAKFRKLGLLKVRNKRVYSADCGFYVQAANRYVFNVANIIKSISSKCKKVKLLSKKMTLSSDTHITNNTLTNTNIDLDPLSSNKLEAEAKASLLMKLITFKNIKEAWNQRGKRYVDKKSGGIFIHSSHVNNPEKMIGYVNNTPAADYVYNMLIECQKILK